jgi:UDP-N-acetylglucosamine 2-epimerase (non-hydrolysing)/GDP/UDP-N,N'-diacetylbacillosamine 2-epimerase (hydrolysing)
MNTYKKIAVVTGSRADYGLLYWVLHELRESSDFELQLLVTGMHLAPEFGMTVSEIELDDFVISQRIECLLSSDSPGGVAKSMAIGLIGMSDALERLQPEVVILLGDRFEIMVAAQACLVHGIPIAHIAGGDTTEGAFDEAIRHSITKMAHVHFVTNELSAQRVKQLGEDPKHIHIVGNPGLDHLKRLPLLSRQSLEKSLGAPLAKRNFLVTFHPVTLESGESDRQFAELLAALDELDADTALWFTQPNADTGGRSLAAMLEAWSAARIGRVHVHASLGQLRYLSLMAQVDAVIGNSSSGLYEAPSFQVPTVNIGNRQRGRLAPKSVLHCSAERVAIRETILNALTLDCKDVQNPFGDGNSATRIMNILRELPPSTELIKKQFHMFGGLDV